MSHEPRRAAAPLQDAVLRLQHFWADRGCLVLPPCDFPVPFATLHPEAFFGVLGSAPWRVAFAQPIRRPLDGRYGDHPYRLGRHHQLEVLLKPPPRDVRRLYLESLAALGYDLRSHDVRFAEWCWEPRSVGARGSGWHALVDGLGVTRLTFLERLADRDLDPLTVELSYGLERLLMPLQGAESAFSVEWSADGTHYGHLWRRDEESTSRYVFETADVEELRRRFEALDREAGRCLEAGLARPAFEQAVRCLEPIDLLEARGDMTARERTRWLDRVRKRVVAAADLYLGEAPAAEALVRPSLSPAAERGGEEARPSQRPQRARRRRKRSGRERKRRRAEAEEARE